MSATSKSHIHLQKRITARTFQSWNDMNSLHVTADVLKLNSVDFKQNNSCEEIWGQSSVLWQNQALHPVLWILGRLEEIFRTISLKCNTSLPSNKSQIIYKISIRLCFKTIKIISITLLKSHLKSGIFNWNITFFNFVLGTCFIPPWDFFNSTHQNHSRALVSPL